MIKLTDKFTWARGKYFRPLDDITSSKIKQLKKQIKALKADKES